MNVPNLDNPVAFAKKVKSKQQRENVNGSIVNTVGNIRSE